MSSKAIKFTLVGHVMLKSNDATALQEAANAVIELQKKIETLDTVKVTEVRTSVGVIKP